MALLLSDVQGPVNLASGQPTTIGELVTALADAGGDPISYASARWPPPPGANRAGGQRDASA